MGGMICSTCLEKKQITTQMFKTISDVQIIKMNCLIMVPSRGSPCNFPCIIRLLEAEATRKSALEVHYTCSYTYCVWLLPHYTADE
jgi:hypothetical protein